MFISQDQEPKSKAKVLNFKSEFETGNLEYAFLHPTKLPHTAVYSLFPQLDTNADHAQNWFFFTASNFDPATTYKFVIQIALMTELQKPFISLHGQQTNLAP
jgi:hypothetical protein